MLVFLVEDSPTQAEYFKDVLQEEGLDVLTVPNGWDALTLAVECKPDLIVLDLNLPDIDGFQVCSRLKRDEVTKDIPVIMLTGNSSPQKVMEGLRLGVVDYVSKNDFAPVTIRACLLELNMRKVEASVARGRL